MSNRAGQRFTPGTDTFVAADSATGPYSTVFEDNGETGYFYAYDRKAKSVLDAVLIYNVSSVVERDRESFAKIIWSEDGLKSALLINDYPHAVFDFEAKRGYSRKNFPNLPSAPNRDWDRSTHQWDDAALQSFRSSERRDQA